MLKMVTATAAALILFVGSAQAELRVQLGGKGAKSGSLMTTEHGVRVWRGAAHVAPSADRPAAPRVAFSVVVNNTWRIGLNRLRTQGFYSGHPGVSRRYSQGFWSGQADWR